MRGDGMGAYPYKAWPRYSHLRFLNNPKGVKQDNDIDVTLMCSWWQISVVYLVNDSIYYKVLSPLLFLYSLNYWKLITLVTPVFSVFFRTISKIYVRRSSLSLMIRGRIFCNRSGGLDYTDKIENCHRAKSGYKTRTSLITGRLRTGKELQST